MNSLLSCKWEIASMHLNYGVAAHKAGFPKVQPPTHSQVSFDTWRSKISKKNINSSCHASQAFSSSPTSAETHTITTGLTKSLPCESVIKHAKHLIASQLGNQEMDIWTLWYRNVVFFTRSSMLGIKLMALGRCRQALYQLNYRLPKPVFVLRAAIHPEFSLS